MKTLARPALRSAATSISTMAGVRIRALTERHPIKPTSPRCHSAWQLNLGRHSTYRRGKSVQTTGTTSLRFENADPSFLSPPSCVICYDPDPRYRQDNKGCETQATKDAATNLEVLCLHTNWRLRPDWLRYTDNPLSVPRDAIVLGQRRNKIMYVINRDD